MRGAGGRLWLSACASAGAASLEQFLDEGVVLGVGLIVAADVGKVVALDAAALRGGDKGGPVAGEWVRQLLRGERNCLAAMHPALSTAALALHATHEPGAAPPPLALPAAPAGAGAAAPWGLASGLEASVSYSSCSSESPSSS